jgi:hypothetical protein
VQAARPTVPASAGDAHRIRSVRVTFTPSAAQTLATEPEFTAEGLSEAIEIELRARNLLDPLDPEARDTLAVAIDEFAVRSTSNAVLFGYVLSRGTLGGNLEVLNSDGQEVKKAWIHARAQLVKPASGEQPTSFAPLYQGFAGMTVRNLTGAPEPVSVNH